MYLADMLLGFLGMEEVNLNDKCPKRHRSQAPEKIMEVWWRLNVNQPLTGWWFQTFFNFHPYLGKIPNLTDIFQRG